MSKSTMKETSSTSTTTPLLSNPEKLTFHTPTLKNKSIKVFKVGLQKLCYLNCWSFVNPSQSDLWSSPMALWMATRPLPSLDWPSLLSRAYIFFSEKLQPRKSKWAEFTAISLGYSMFSTCTQRQKCCRCLDENFKVMVVYLHLLPGEDKQICQGHDSKHWEGINSAETSLLITEFYLTIFQKCYKGRLRKVKNSYLLALIRKVISIHEAAPFGGVAM